MLAIEGGLTHLNVAKTMAEKDPSLVTLKLDTGLTVSNWAQKNGHDVFFKVCFLYLTNQHYFLSPFLLYQTFTKLGIEHFVLNDSMTSMNYKAYC